MQHQATIDEVRSVLRNFQEGYKTRDVSKLDEFIQLFIQSDDAELIGIGAASRNGNEWFQGIKPIREIIESDWLYWGNVELDVEGAKISLLSDVAWLSTTGKVIQCQAFDEAMKFYVEQMKTLLEDENANLDQRMMEATHYGMRRLRERQKGSGYGWPFVLTAVLVRRKGNWLFHTIHWSMPVD
jgi:hypothetical protein